MEPVVFDQGEYAASTAHHQRTVCVARTMEQSFVNPLFMARERMQRQIRRFFDDARRKPASLSGKY